MNVEDRGTLRDLAELIAYDLKIDVEKVFSHYDRGRASLARQILALAATDEGFPHLAVSHFLQKDPSYVTQIRRRKHALRKTSTYLFAQRFLKRRLEKANANTR